MTKQGVYYLRLSNNKMYIGASRDVHLRINDHLAKLKKGKHFCKSLQHDYNGTVTYGILQIIDNDRHLAYWEAYWMEFYNSYVPNGYNRNVPIPFDIPTHDGNLTNVYGFVNT